MGSYLVCGERENNSKTVSNFMEDFILGVIGPQNDTSGNGWALRTEDFAKLIIAMSYKIGSLTYSSDVEKEDLSMSKRIFNIFSLALADMIIKEERYTYVRWE